MACRLSLVAVGLERNRPTRKTSGTRLGSWFSSVLQKAYRIVMPRGFKCSRLDARAPIVNSLPGTHRSDILTHLRCARESCTMTRISTGFQKELGLRVIKP